MRTIAALLLIIAVLTIGAVATWSTLAVLDEPGQEATATRFKTGSGTPDPTPRATKVPQDTATPQFKNTPTLLPESSPTVTETVLPTNTPTFTAIPLSTPKSNDTPLPPTATWAPLFTPTPGPSPTPLPPMKG